MPDPPSHYFDERPETPSAPARVEVVLADVRLSLTTDRGVFGHARLDPGTRLLLQEAPPPSPDGDLLDLGCGYGAIALTMAVRAPGATVWAVDVNERARRLCADNARDHGLTNVRVCAPDEVPADIRFATIWSNPPIRIGKAALHDLLLRWLERLDGEAVLVVHRHLGSDSLQRWLEHEGHSTMRLVSRAGYRLLVVRG
ncbi:MAG: class I SAM-dependent methyltransferase [Ilumatobacteraceae bacterium]